MVEMKKKCYDYSVCALNEIDFENYEEYIPVLYIKAISYGDIIKENDKLKQTKKEKMKEKELGMLKELLDYNLETYDDKKYSEYRSYVLSPYLAYRRYSLYLQSNERLEFLYNRCLESIVEKEKYERSLFNEYKALTILYIINNKENELPDCFCDIEKYYVRYLDKNITLTVDTINKSIDILKKIEKTYIESSREWQYYNLEDINMPLSIFIFTTYSFLEKYMQSKQVYSYKDLYASFYTDLNNPNGYIENRKNNLLKRREAFNIQNKIERLQMATREQNDEIIRQNEDLKKEISKLKESSEKNTKKLEWELEKMKTSILLNNK